MLLGGMVLGYKVLRRYIIKRLFPRNNPVSVMINSGDVQHMLMKVVLGWEERRKSQE